MFATVLASLWLLASSTALAASLPEGEQQGSCSSETTAANAVSMLQPARASSSVLLTGPHENTSKEAKDVGLDAKAKDAKAPSAKANDSTARAPKAAASMDKLANLNETEGDPCVRAKEAKKALDAFHEELIAAEAEYNKTKAILDDSEAIMLKNQDAIDELHKKVKNHSQARSVKAARTPKNHTSVVYLQMGDTPWNLTAEEAARMETVLPGSSMEFSTLALAVAIDEELCEMQNNPPAEEPQGEEKPSKEGKPAESCSARLGLALLVYLLPVFALRT